MRFCPCLSRREYDLFRAFVSKSLRVHRISRVIKQVSGTVFMLQGVNLLAIRTLHHQTEGRLFMEMGVDAASGASCETLRAVSGRQFLTFSSARASLLDYATMLVGYKRSICPETGRLRWRDSAYPILRLI